MKKRKVLLTNEAIYDLADIEDYIEQEFSAKEVIAFQQKTDELIKLLSETIAFTGKTFLPYRGFYIYKGLVKPSIFLYYKKW